jgi:hypothetical protein
MTFKMDLFRNTLSWKFTIDISLKWNHDACRSLEIILLPNDVRFPQGHYFLEGSQALPICLPGKSIMGMKMSIVLRCGQKVCKVLKFTQALCSAWGQCWFSKKCIRVDGNVQEKLEEVRLMPSAWDVSQDQAAIRNRRNPEVCLWGTVEAVSQELHQD